MWEELAGKVGHYEIHSLSANHAYLKALYDAVVPLPDTLCH